MSTPLGAFVTQLSRFMDELVETIPEEKDIKMAREAINSAKRINPRLILDMFNIHIQIPFKEAIMRGDIEYLVVKGREKIATEFNEIMTAITIFDKQWGSLTEANRDAILKYLKVLCVLCDRAIGGGA